MPTYYVGPGGNDGNNGLTWALRKLTLNGAEDVPVVAGDIVYVGPGVYREQLTIDVSGGAGNVIIYIGDVTGENTDGVGGIVRITGSDNDQTPARNNGIMAANKDYRTFRGFVFDLTIFTAITATGGCDNWIVEDCFFQNLGGININIADAINCIIRRCIFTPPKCGGFADCIRFIQAALADDVNHLVENCLLMGTQNNTLVQFRNTGDCIVRNCTLIGGALGVYVPIALNAGHSIIVNNCILQYINSAIWASAVVSVTENFNTFFGNNTDRVNTNVGANSLTFPPLHLQPTLYSGEDQISGFKFPWWFSELSEWSQVRAITGANERTEDLRGLIRPVTAAKNSWGPTQFMEMEREIGTVRTGVSSMVLLDAGINQMFIPITGAQITVEVYVQREANYAGVNPQMIIKQPGQADRVTLDAGAAGAWNQLTDTFTPAALPPYVIVEFVSNNTAAAGAYSTFFDDLEVS